MSHLIQDIARINDELYLENKRLREQQELDNELIKDLGRQLIQAHNEKRRLEDELNELRRMQQPSNASGGSSAGTVAAPLHPLPTRSSMQRPSVGD